MCNLRNKTNKQKEKHKKRDKARKNILWNKRQYFYQMVLEKLDSDMWKNKTGPFSYTMHKNKFKMGERPKCETRSHQNPRGEHRQHPL